MGFAIPLTLVYGTSIYTCTHHNMCTDRCGQLRRHATFEFEKQPLAVWHWQFRVFPCLLGVHAGYAVGHFLSTQNFRIANWVFSWLQPTVSLYCKERPGLALRPSLVARWYCCALDSVLCIIPMYRAQTVCFPVTNRTQKHLSGRVCRQRLSSLGLSADLSPD